MLSIVDRRSGRRDFLRVGSLALGGLTLPQLLAARATGAESLVRDRSVIFLFLHGGPSQTETFDPKMTAPIESRSATGEIDTCLPGITFGSTFPGLARMANRFSVVRSYRSGDANHDIKPIVSKDTSGASLGAIYARLAGTNHPVNGMPRNVALYPRAVDPSTQAANMGFGKFGATGDLGAAYAPFVPGDSGAAAMKLSLPRERLDDRKSLLVGLDRIRREVDTQGAVQGMDRFQQQAFDTIVGGVADAFDLSKEDPRTIAAYDTALLVRPDQISRRWNNYNNYVDNAKSLGRLMLLARRMCEAGCGFVTVTTNFVWDMHADVNNAGVEEGMQYMGRPLDHALTAFLDDVKARGLTDKILLVVTGEMGRTPRINKNGGRDHWGNITPLLVSGGGIRPGQVIGQSTRDAGEPATEPFDKTHLTSTIFGQLFDLGLLRVTRGVPVDLARFVAGNVGIPGLT